MALSSKESEPPQNTGQFKLYGLISMLVHRDTSFTPVQKSLSLIRFLPKPFLRGSRFIVGIADFIAQPYAWSFHSSHCSVLPSHFISIGTYADDPVLPILGAVIEV